MTKLIPLSKGKRYAKVDDEDFEKLNQHKWSLGGGGKGYATRRENGKIISMHREIMGVPENMVIDHINHDGCDNRKENMRMCTQEENQKNKAIHKNNTTGYKGVYWDKFQKKYHAKIKFDGKLYHIGLFKNPVDAARAYDEEARKLFGEFAFLNFS